MQHISETWFQNLLASHDALEPVSVLSSIWSARADGQLPMFGLTQPEYWVTLCTIYTGEVGNGGHTQFFLNRGLTTARDTTAALQGVGLKDLAEVFSDAAEEMKGAEPDTIPEAAEPVLAACDKRFDSMDRGVNETLLAFMRARQDDILRAERQLPDRGASS